MGSRHSRWHKARLFLFTLGCVVLSGCLRASGSFVDDFSDPGSGWGAASHETYVRGYQQGRYLIQIDVPRWFVWATAGRTYEQVEIETVTQSSGEMDNHYGVLCRYRKGQSYYFAISADGYYGIFLQQNEEALVPLHGAAMLRSPAIRTDGSPNRLLATCEGVTLTLYVNGEQIARVEDDTLKRGDVGMAVGTSRRGSTTVWFDDYTVSPP
jgi:hypothetical protein